MDLTKVLCVLSREMFGAVLVNRGENEHDEVLQAGREAYDKLQAAAINDGVVLMPYPFSAGGSASTDVETTSASQVALVPEIIQYSSGVAITAGASRESINMKSRPDETSRASVKMISGHAEVGRASVKMKI